MLTLPPLLRDDLLSDVVHGFTTRVGGVSPAPRESLHLALRPDDRPDDVVENWRRVGRAAGFDIGSLVLLDQVHGAGVVIAEHATGPSRTLAQADGVITSRPGLVLAIRTADCVPVLLAAPGGVGAAHAGWRGVVAGVVPATVSALASQVGCEPGQIRSVVGPCASVEHYETGAEVVDALVSAGLDREQIARLGPRGREHADLRAAVSLQLAAAGVRQVSHVQRCTIGDERLFSHRRQGATAGRLASFVGVRP